MTHRVWVVYQCGIKFGYRGIGSELGAKYAGTAANKLMQAMVGSGEVDQCWGVVAESGNKAITKVKQHIKSNGITQ